MPDNDMSTQRELATHAADIKHLQEAMDKLLNQMETMQKTLGDIEKTLSEAKGGWKMLLLVGGAGGALGSFLTNLPSWFPHK